MSDVNLHQIEKKILFALKELDGINIDALPSITGLKIDQVRRGIEWLKFKNLSATLEKSENKISIYNDSIITILPERILIENIINDGRKSIPIKDLSKIISFSEQDFNAALKYAVKNGWIVKEDGNITLGSSQDKSEQERLLAKIIKNKTVSVNELNNGEIKVLESIKKRPKYIVETKHSNVIVFLTAKGKKVSSETNLNFIEEIGKFTPEILSSGKWKSLKFSPIDVSAQVRNYYFGRVHPLVELLEEVREIFVSMGFSEIDGNIVQSSFWNFDVLFTPQDHPAREMQDTFYLSGNVKKNIPDASILDKVSEIHEKGWKYEWRLDESDRIVLRTHTTPVTIRYLASHKPNEARIFSIGRVFRNEKMSYKHLMEFHQVEGIVTGDSVNLRDLMGLQKLFYAKLGINKVKFWPTFFPYTEPSLQSMVYIEKLGKWVELFGMGMFRPEVTSAIGISTKVLAWGGGLERIAMIRYGLDDVRELYGNKLSWLRNEPLCQL